MPFDDTAEARLRQLLRDPGWSLPPWPDPQERVRRAARRQRLRLAGAALGAGALVIAATAIPLALASAGRGPSPSGHGRPGWSRLCQVPPPAGLRRALHVTVSPSQRQAVYPFGLSADRRSMFVETYSRAFSGVATVNVRTGALTRIQRFARPARGEALGAADGRFLVWEKLSMGTVYAWDSLTGTLRELAHLGGLFSTPAVSGHYAAWVDRTVTGNVTVIRLANLLTGQIRVIRRGYLGVPFLDGNLVVWPEWSRRGGEPVLRASSVTTGRAARLPTVLAAAKGAQWLVTDGAQTAYVAGPGNTRLYYSPAQDQAAHQVLSLPGHFSYLVIGPGWLAFDTYRRAHQFYLASMKTGAFAQVTSRYGEVTAAGPEAIISDYGGKNVPHPINPVHLVNPVAITWPACPAGGRLPHTAPGGP